MPNPPGATRRAGGSFSGKKAPETTPASPKTQYRCASCGTEGRLSLADPHPADQLPILRLIGRNGDYRLLCGLCRQ
jgi:hypothetical protein